MDQPVENISNNYCQKRSARTAMLVLLNSFVLERFSPVFYVTPGLHEVEIVHIRLSNTKF